MARITGKEIADEYRAPSYDLVQELRKTRARWLGHFLRMDQNSHLHRTIKDLHNNNYPGSLVSNTPDHDNLEDLICIARDRDLWREFARNLSPSHGSSAPSWRRRVREGARRRRRRRQLGGKLLGFHRITLYQDTCSGTPDDQISQNKFHSSYHIVSHRIISRIYNARCRARKKAMAQHPYETSLCLYNQFSQISMTRKSTQR